MLLLSFVEKELALPWVFIVLRSWDFFLEKSLVCPNTFFPTLNNFFGRLPILEKWDKKFPILDFFSWILEMDQS